MQATIKECLEAVGLDHFPENSDEDLRDYGLDSLMSVLLFSEIENKLGISLNSSDFKEDSFSTLNKIEEFITASKK